MSAPHSFAPDHRSRLGTLYRGDCMAVLPQIASASVDLIFADPPFNLGKSYASKMNDAIPEHAYLKWCEGWIEECVRVLKPGGSFFLYNLPKWNLALGAFLNQRLTFRHWVTIEMTYTLPIAGRLYPSHYSLLYYCKGQRPTTFTPDRLAIGTCPHCYHELKDYGGYKDKMNPDGVSLTDVWKDIPPVRHAKFKRRSDANELSIKLLDRVITMASKPGDLVLDPFGGSGSTYAVAEIKDRRWLGIELGPIDQIVSRMQNGNLAIERKYIEAYRSEINALFPPVVADARKAEGIWTPGNIPKSKSRDRTKYVVVQQAELVLQEPAGIYSASKTKSSKTAQRKVQTRKSA